MNNLLKPVLASVLLASLLSACALKSKLTELEIADKYQPVVSLEASINDADQAMLKLLSQRSFKLAAEASQESKSLAVKDKHEALNVAARGENYLMQAKNNAEKARDIFSEVLDARALAISHGASKQSPKKLSELEIEFKKMTLDLEQGNIENAILHRVAMIESYQSLELTSLKKSTVDDAKQHLDEAKAADADTYASKTFNMAKKELSLALSMLDANKESKEKAEKHAAQVVWLAEKSISITATAKAFKENDFSSEDIILWHQEQLVKSVEPLNVELPLNLPAKNLVESISKTISKVVKINRNLVQERDNMQIELAKSNEHLNKVKTAKKEDLLALESKYQNDNKKRKDIEIEKRTKLEFIQGLFNADEANVYREKDNILIRAQGFHFASGQSEIDSRNFSILNKIGSAISQYPNSSVTVTGHTDSNGYHKTNLKLSKLRADKVMKFLNEVGGTSLERLTSEGFGEQKPVASNETEAGRTKNRRVEILIIN